MATAVTSSLIETMPSPLQSPGQTGDTIAVGVAVDGALEVGLATPVVAVGTGTVAVDRGIVAIAVSVPVGALVLVAIASGDGVPATGVDVAGDGRGSGDGDGLGVGEFVGWGRLVTSKV